MMKILSDNEVIGEIRRALGDRLLDAENPRARRIFIRIRSEDLRETVSFLSRELDVKHLSTITGIDLGKEIELIYHFSYKGSIEISVKLTIDRDSPEVESITDLIPGAVLYEREVHDILGVKFTGHPDLSRLILPEEWPDGVHPLRKDYTYEELRRMIQAEEGD